MVHNVARSNRMYQESDDQAREASKGTQGGQRGEIEKDRKTRINDSEG